MMTPTPEQVAKPFAFVRVSRIGNLVSGFHEAKSDGSAPDVELKSESLLPLYDAAALDAALSASSAQVTKADAEIAKLREALEDALKTARFEKHPFRAWHILAEDALKGKK